MFTLDRYMALAALWDDYAVSRGAEDRVPRAADFDRFMFWGRDGVSSDIADMLQELQDAGAISRGGRAVDYLTVIPCDTEEAFRLVLGAHLDGLLVSGGVVEPDELVAGLPGRSGFDLICEMVEAVLEEIEQAVTRYEASRVDPGTALFDWASSLEEQCASAPEIVTSPFGSHNVTYDEDEDGERYATVGFVLPDDVFAEIEGGTYGGLVGLRVYPGAA